MDNIKIVQMSETDPDMAKAAAIPVVAFGDNNPINLLMEPEPRASEDVRKRRAGVRFRCQLVSSRSIAFKAMQGEEVVGVAMWNPPGYRFPDKLSLDDLPEAIREGFEGMDLDYLTEFEHALQEARESLGIDAWRLALLAVHPDHQRKGIGGKLLDIGLQMVDSSDPPLPTVLESSPEGFKLYNTRGFELSTAVAHVRGLNEPLPVMVRAAQDKR